MWRRGNLHTLGRWCEDYTPTLHYTARVTLCQITRTRYSGAWTPGTGCIIHHPPHLIIKPLLQDTVTFPSWQTFKKRVLCCLVSSLSPTIRSLFWEIDHIKRFMVEWFYCFHCSFWSRFLSDQQPTGKSSRKLEILGYWIEKMASNYILNTDQTF